MLAMLEEMVLTPSGTHHKAGVDRMARLVRGAFASMPVTVESVVQQDYGDHLIVRSEAVPDANGQILLVGHMDTVFPADSDFNWFRRGDRCCYGPGVSDMKGGLVVGIFALKALAAGGYLPQLPLAFVFNADEEIGSPTSGDLIRQQARQSVAAFVLESAGPAGEVVTGRKGNLSLRLAVSGRAGHAAFAGADKASAILALARTIVALEGLNDHATGVTVNVGRIDGGIGPNTVADRARAWVDCRFVTPQQKAALEERIAAIVEKTGIAGTCVRVDILSSRPPMPVNARNAELFEIVRAVGLDLNQTIGEEYRQGVSDANLIAAEHIAVVDGLGPLGGEDHSTEEYLLIDSLVPRATLLAHAILTAHRQFSA
jgi:glutamate carboxypeptidase